MSVTYEQMQDGRIKEISVEQVGDTKITKERVFTLADAKSKIDSHIASLENHKASLDSQLSEIRLKKTEIGAIK